MSAGSLSMRRANDRTRARGELAGVMVEGRVGGKDGGFEQLPEGVEWEVLAHVWGGREQQEVVRSPRQLPGRVEPLHPGQGLRYLVPFGAANVEVGAAIRP